MNFVKRALENPIPLPLARLVPLPDMFAHASDIHGQKHVARVMVHGFLLVDLLGQPQHAAPLWACIYLHDLARLHDGVSREHGADAVMQNLPALRPFFAEAGVAEESFAAIETAVSWHSLVQELPKEHPHWPLTALLKDADGLDRVRLGDLDPTYLRYDASKELVDYAEGLYRETHLTIEPGERYFEKIWPIARDLWLEKA
jgi:hypothetical protein